MSLLSEFTVLLYQSFGIGLLPRLNRKTNRFERCRSVALFFALFGLSTSVYTLWRFLGDLPPAINFNVVTRIVQHVLVNALYLEFLAAHHYFKFEQLQRLWAALLRIDGDLLAAFNAAPQQVRFINVKLAITNATYVGLHAFYIWMQPDFFTGFVFVNEIFVKFCLHTSKFIMSHVLVAIRLRVRAIAAIVERNDASKLDAHDVLARIHMRCADAVDVCNELYGVNMVLSVTHLVLYVLRLVTVVLDKDSSTHARATLLMLVMWTVYGFVQACMVVYMSQKVADAFRENIAKVYKAMAYYNHVPSVHKRLSRLAKQMQARSPPLTAAGFFNVDLSMLFTLVNLITTYTVVVVQFSTSTQGQPCQVTPNLNSTPSLF